MLWVNALVCFDLTSGKQGWIPEAMCYILYLSKVEGYSYMIGLWLTISFWRSFCWWHASKFCLVVRHGAFEYLSTFSYGWVLIGVLPALIGYDASLSPSAILIYSPYLRWELRSIVLSVAILLAWAATIDRSPQPIYSSDWFLKNRQEPIDCKMFRGFPQNFASLFGSPRIWKPTRWLQYLPDFSLNPPLWVSCQGCQGHEGLRVSHVGPPSSQGANLWGHPQHCKRIIPIQVLGKSLLRKAKAPKSRKVYDILKGLWSPWQSCISSIELPGISRIDLCRMESRTVLSRRNLVILIQLQLFHLQGNAKASLCV